MPCALASRGDNAAALLRGLYLADLHWELGGRGPQAFDCYSLTQLIQWHLFGRVLMDVAMTGEVTRRDIVMAMRHHEAHVQWQPLEGPGAHGDALHMAHRDDPWHIGTFLNVDRGVVAHCSERQGLRVDSLTELVASGWTSLRFFRFCGDVA
jgi:hypothetical protein